MRHSGTSDLGRRRGTRPERGRILVVAEGQQTERQYLEGFAKFARATGLSIHPADVHGLGRDPLSVVRKAVRLRDEDARRQRSPRDRYDAVWCVFDVDDHGSLVDATAAAEREDIRVAISNPCFEIWLLWHFEDYFRSANAGDLRRKLKPRGCGEKAIPRTFDYGNYVAALRRSDSRPAPSQPYAVPSNPGTGVASLIRESLGHKCP